MIPFSFDSEMQKMAELTQEFLEHVLYDEEPLFIRDEATIWDVSMSTGEELTKRISDYYRKTVSESALKQPLWKLFANLTKAQIAAN
jgi:hypothetical protein